MPSQVVPIPDAVANIPGRTSKATTEVVFQAVDLPSLGFRSFFVQYKDSALSSESLLQIHKKQQFTIGFQVNIMDKLGRSKYFLEYPQRFYDTEVG